MKLFRERFGQTPSLLVDTGYFMSDERNVHGKLRPDTTVKDDWVFKAYNQFPVDVINLSSHDLSYFSSILLNPKSSRRSGSEPLLNKLISANTLSESATALKPHTFVIRELGPGSDGKGRPLRVAIVGLTETTPEPPLGFKFVGPVEAARRTIPEARKKADFVIVLAKVKTEEAARIAREAPGSDVIIAGNAQSVEQSFTPPFYVGNTIIIFTPFETRMLGELRVYRTAEGKFSTRQRFISLDEIIPDDPVVRQMVRAATTAEVDAQAQSNKLLQDWLALNARLAARPPVIESGRTLPAYVTTAACIQCHRAQYMQWSSSAHAHTVDRLLPRAIEFEAGCLECHATGPKPANGVEKPEMTRFQNVQCEACHGPGSDHVAKPGKGYGRIVDMRTACASCHTAQTSPAFDHQAAWAKIKH